MAVIKIDDELYKRIKKLIKEGDNRFDYPTVKAFVDKAVFSTIKELEQKETEQEKKNSEDIENSSKRYPEKRSPQPDKRSEKRPSDLQGGEN